VRQIEGPDHLFVVLGVLGRRVWEHEDGAVAQDLVRQLIHRHDLVERLLEGHAVELHGRGPVLHFAVVADVDAGGTADDAEDVAKADVVEAQVQRLARRRIEDWFGRRGACALAQLLDRRHRPRGLDALADRAIELGDLGRRQAIARIVLARQPVLAERRLELILLLESVRALEVGARRRLHRPLQRNLVIRVVRRRLDGPAVRRHRFVQISSAHRHFALTERLACRAPTGRQRQDNDADPQATMCPLHHAPVT
jgi:hypothetical protein